MTSPRFLIVLPLLFAAAPATAQGVDDLPNRPIKRAEVIAVVKRQFAAMDANHDGRVTQAEFERYRAKQAPADSMGAFAHVGGHWFEHADTEGRGYVTLADAEARPLKFFDMADRNGDGVVDLQERQMASMLMGLVK